MNCIQIENFDIRNDVGSHFLFAFLEGRQETEDLSLPARQAGEALMLVFPKLLDIYCFMVEKQVYLLNKNCRK